jgi:ubiquinone/menaquinone biosynthesis C-methylase UbiE
MQRVNTPELLDSNDCPPHEIAASLQDMSRINRWFGGVATTRSMIERLASSTGKRSFTLLEVAAGFGEVPRLAGQQLARKGITINVTHLDRDQSHLLPGTRAVAADALALPFSDNAFDLIGCSLFAHHLEPDELAQFAAEAVRVSRCAVLINDLIRHPLHVAMVYAGFPLLRSYVSRNDGVASVKRAYVPDEMSQILASGVGSAGKIEISQHFLFRMGAIIRKTPAE